MKVTIYTDGACKGNPGPGGWGVLLRFKDQEKVLKGAEAQTTNNRMELTAAIEGLKALKKPCCIDLYTDSQYLRQGMTKWMFAWKKNQWRNAQKQPVKNQDLWQALDALTSMHEIHWHWVKAHNGHPDNERVDALANEAVAALLAEVS